MSYFSYTYVSVEKTTFFRVDNGFSFLVNKEGFEEVVLDFLFVGQVVLMTPKENLMLLEKSSVTEIQEIDSTILQEIATRHYAFLSIRLCKGALVRLISFLLFMDDYNLFSLSDYTISRILGLARETVSRSFRILKKKVLLLIAFVRIKRLLRN